MSMPPSDTEAGRPHWGRSVRAALAMVTRGLDGLAAMLVVVTLSAMFVALLVNVILRYVFSTGIPWAYEIHSILFPWLVAGGAVMAAVRGRNIAVTAIVRLLPELGRRIVALAVHVIIVVTAIAVIDTSFPIVMASRFSILAETRIPQIYGYASLLFGFALVALIAAMDAARLLLGEQARDTEPGRTSMG
ncbi:TRAP transporter small permease [Roseospira visakhapatnamensis]|uniref:TRAP transporter small permease protein n=1 Tax=Roseospira visakhapatnamensis TaxID=390880 RepID=A0A7W6W9H3_9PROT|nr:TRAP transporter small permease [Roseospira visakhapatnamensis]MBB4265457.1 TRAP-type C4-dicarboxylate transport system permease small subunit [Roseospira visakhapatnamensis]